MANKKKQLVLGFNCAEGYERQALILLRSLRLFGGTMAEMPVWIFIPEGRQLNPEAKQALSELRVRFLSFPIDDSFAKFPFAMKTVAAAAAEKQTEEEDCILAWHDRTGFIRQAPTAFLLPENKSFGFRPTDIANIGAPFGKPIPPFWETICAHFEIQPAMLPPIITAIDQQKLHLYVNAGLLVVRPKKRILRTWAAYLKQTYHLPKFTSFYHQKQAYAIFLHQAALTAAVVNSTLQDERAILPAQYLFSVDNFFDYPSKSRPESLDDIVTGRFHDFFALDNWEKLITASGELIDWFKAQLKEGAYWPKKMI